MGDYNLTLSLDASAWAGRSKGATSLSLSDFLEHLRLYLNHPKGAIQNRDILEGLLIALEARTLEPDLLTTWTQIVRVLPELAAITLMQQKKHVAAIEAVALWGVSIYHSGLQLGLLSLRDDEISFAHSFIESYFLALYLETSESIDQIAFEPVDTLGRFAKPYDEAIRIWCSLSQTDRKLAELIARDPLLVVLMIKQGLQADLSVRLKAIPAALKTLDDRDLFFFLTGYSPDADTIIQTLVSEADLPQLAQYLHHDDKDICIGALEIIAAFPQPQLQSEIMRCFSRPSLPLIAAAAKALSKIVLVQKGLSNFDELKQVSLDDLTADIWPGLEAMGGQFKTSLDCLFVEMLPSWGLGQHLISTIDMIEMIKPGFTYIRVQDLMSGYLLMQYLNPEITLILHFNLDRDAASSPGVRSLVQAGAHWEHLYKAWEVLMAHFGLNTK